MTVAGPPGLPSWEPESPPEDDFAQLAAQVRLGTQQKAVNEASRRKRQRLLAASGIAVVVAAAIVILIERFYDPEAAAREKAIAAEVSRMAEQQQVTDKLALIEIDIESAIMNNDLDTARRELALLVEQSPQHPRREFLQASIDRAAELARLSGQGGGGAPSQSAPAQAAMIPSSGERSSTRPRAAERAADRADRVASRPADRSSAARNQAPAAAAPRAYGAPLGEVPRQTLPLNAPINAAPVTTVGRAETPTSFSGRTLEAGDPQTSRAAGSPPPPAAPAAAGMASTSLAGSAVAPMPSSAPPPSRAGSADVDVIPAKIVKRVTPVAPAGIPRKANGYVVVKFSIGTNGRVTDLEVVESSPPGMFDEAAQDAVRKWLYEPRKENGVPVASTAKARLVFDPAN
jgi:TonB family protein